MYLLGEIGDMRGARWVEHSMTHTRGAKGGADLTVCIPLLCGVHEDARVKNV